VRKVLLVTASLDYTGPARLLSLLAAGLPPGQAHVCVLEKETPWCSDLRAAGVGVEVLSWSRFVDPRPLLSLRKWIARERPEVIHAWGQQAAWALLLTGCCAPRTLFLSAALPPGRRLSFPERWLVRNCGRVVAIGQAEADSYRRLGVADSRLSVAPPAVSVHEAATPASLRGLPEDARVLLVVGPFAMHKGHREAVWTLNIMRCLYDDVDLVIVGRGPDEPRVRRFAEVIHMTEWVHHTHDVADVRPWLARAEVVWVPSLREGGRQTALEAMAAGRPVVASRLPGLAEVIDDGRTGYLVTPGDKAELARQTRILFENAELRRQMGQAAKAHVAERFAPARMIEAIAQVYQHERPQMG
jgi:glycosyltransferase involved in cell wall biosynthesis